MKESKAYNTYLSYATGAVPPKVARKFKKASPSKKDSVPVQADEEPVQKSKRVKRAAKKSSTTPAAGIVIREPTVETKSKRKEKEKVDIAHGKRIELLSNVALTEEARIKKVKKKCLKDFHKTHPIGSGTVVEDPPRVAKITPIVTSEGTGDKPGVPDVMNDDSTESESESWEQEEESKDDDQDKDEIIHTTSPTDDDNLESKSDDVSEGNKEIKDTTNQFDDDVDARLKEPTQTDKEIVQGEGDDTEMHESQQGNEILDTTQEQVVDDAHVTITTIAKKTEGPVASSSLSSDLASKFLNFSYIPQTDAEIVYLLDVHVHHEVLRTQAPTLLSVLVSVIPESSPVFTNIPQSSHTFTPTPIQKDNLRTQVTSLVDSHLGTILGETRQEFMNFLSESLTARIKEQVKDQLPQILPQEVSNFAPPVIEKLIKESRDEVTLAKASSQPQSTYEAASTLTEFQLKKILLDKMEKSKSYLTAPEHRDCYDGLKKYYALDNDFFYSYDEYSLKRSRKDKDKDEDPSAGSDRGLKKRKIRKDSVQSEELVFEVADSDLPQDQEGNLGDNDDEPRKETSSRSDWFKKPTPHQEPTNPDWNIGKTTQEGPTQNWLMTLADSTFIDKSLKDIDELMSTPIDFSSYVLNGLKIENLTQEILLGPTFRLLKGTHSSYAELEYVNGSQVRFARTPLLDLIYKVSQDRTLVSFSWRLPRISLDLSLPSWALILKKVAVSLSSSAYRSHASDPSIILGAFAREHPTGVSIHYEKCEILLGANIKQAHGKVICAFSKYGIKLGDNWEMNTMERFDTSTGNPVKEILLKLNLPDHRSILTDSKIHSPLQRARFMIKQKGHQQAAKGKKDDEEFREIRWW
ncbi:hypothetical protein Tco_0429839 [Tanacetum coccineum]